MIQLWWSEFQIIVISLRCMRMELELLKLMFSKHNSSTFLNLFHQITLTSNCWTGSFIVCCTGGSSLRRKLTSKFVAKFGIDRAPKFLASEISRPWKRERNKESNWNMSKQLYLNKTGRLGLYLNIALASLYFYTGSLWKGKAREPA